MKMFINVIVGQSRKCDSKWRPKGNDLSGFRTNASWSLNNG